MLDFIKVLFHLPALAALALCIPLSGHAESGDPVIYVTASIITMDPGQPRAEAVAVRDGRIIAIGDLSALRAQEALAEYREDLRFADKVLMPGFIDPHVHPSLPAVLTQFPFLAPDDWSLPTGAYPGARDPEAFAQRLRELVSAPRPEGVPFIAWGYHPLWHGEVYRETLSSWFPEQPVMLWHRSFHELILNDRAIADLELTQEDV